MSQENVEIVQELFEAFKRHDRADVVARLDPGIEWYDNPRGGFTDLRPVYLGHEGVNQFMTQVEEVWEEAWPEPEEFIDAGDGRVICAYKLHARVRDSDVPVVSQTMYDVYTVQGANIVERRLYGTRQKALEAVGLRE
jgi:ketosteroid isomerase-like protein